MEISGEGNHIVIFDKEMDQFVDMIQLHRTESEDNLQKFINDTVKAFPRTKIYFSGRVSQEFEFTPKEKIIEYELKIKK